MNDRREKAVVLLSGGLDSVVALKLAMRDRDVIAALTFDYGQRARYKERDLACHICCEWGIPHEGIKLPWLRDWTTTALVNARMELPTTSAESVDTGAHDRARAVWVPNRNGAFIAIAAALAESRSARFVISGFNAEEAVTFPDNSEAFLKATNDALSSSTLNRVTLESPTITMTKEDIAREFLRLGIDPWFFWCCYEDGERLCGRCESCVRAMRAFTKAGGWDKISARFA
jgi:7-cyano-7-deazaguanine synthase